jgi:hypothetical protein
MVFSLSPRWSELCTRIKNQSIIAIAVLETLCDDIVELIGELYRALSTAVTLTKASPGKGARLGPGR